jgi:small subunit ribosomal protein S8
MAHKEEVSVPHSKVRVSILRILEEKKYIGAVRVEEKKPQSEIIIKLRYVKDLPAMKNVKRNSKSGLRVYAKQGSVPRTLGGYGVTIVSTSSGVMSDKEARAKSLGGEVLCQVW